jgi:hypothetical protein
MVWFKRFVDPIVLPDGRKLLTLRDAAEYITALPKAEHDAGCHHQLRPPSTRPFVGPPSSFLSLSRFAQRSSIFASILCSNSSADAVGRPAR